MKKTISLLIFCLFYFSKSHAFNYDSVKFDFENCGDLKLTNVKLTGDYYYFSFENKMPSTFTVNNVIFKTKDNYLMSTKQANVKVKGFHKVKFMIINKNMMHDLVGSINFTCSKD